jgi:hypothetical protein
MGSNDRKMGLASVVGDNFIFFSQHSSKPHIVSSAFFSLVVACCMVLSIIFWFVTQNGFATRIEL